MANTTLKYTIDAFDLVSAGNISTEVTKQLELLKISPETIRRCSLALYEGEINMIIHANGGTVEVVVSEDKSIVVTLKDTGSGIENIQEAMKNGYSTVPPNSKAKQKGFGAGQGLSNMAKYSDYMDIQSKVGVGTTVTMLFK